MPVQATLDAVASPRRRAILRLVWDQELAAGQIAAHFDVSWPAISQNLNVLHQAGLVTRRHDGHYHDEYVRTADGWRVTSSALERLRVDTEGDLPAAFQRGSG